MTTSIIALGSNKGDRLYYLRKALELISSEDSVIKMSSIYETLPFGPVKQSNYLNAAAEVVTSKDIYRFFDFIKKIETEAGRTPSVRWGEREIDIDIIYFDNLIIDEEGLTVPHKGMAERDFVLVPLIEIAPDFIHPHLKKTPAELLKEVSEKNIIRIFPEKF